MTNQPVFLVGALRSGTTLLRLMLDHHPSIINDGEFDFLFDYMRADDNFPDRETFLQLLYGNRIFRAKNLTVRDGLSARELVRDFVAQSAPPGRVPMFNIHRHFDRIPSVFEDALYLHVVRDPRDVARSSVVQGWVGHVYYGVDHWIETEESWQRVRERLPAGSYFEFRYEDVLIDPVPKLTEICRFLGLDFDAAMLSYPSDTTYTAPDAKLTYQWKRRMAARDCELVETKAKELMAIYGYDSSVADPRPPSAAEAARLAVTSKTRRMQWRLNRYGVGLVAQELLARRLGPREMHRKTRLRIDEIDIRHLQ